MISGRITDELEAVIAIKIRGPGGDREIEAVIDTGFNGALSLPRVVISELLLPWRETGWAVLADDSRILGDLFEATVEWHRTDQPIFVDEGCPTTLIGMSLLRGSRLSVEVVENGRLTIEEFD